MQEIPVLNIKLTLLNTISQYQVHQEIPVLNIKLTLLNTISHYQVYLFKKYQLSILS